MNLSKVQIIHIKCVLEERINLARESPSFELSNFQFNAFHSILAKLYAEKFVLKKDEAICLAHLTRDKLKELGNEFPGRPLKTLINIPERILEKMLIVDTLRFVLLKNKTKIEGIFHYPLDISYKDIIETVEKVKNSCHILLSNIDDPYKLCFIYNLEEFLILSLKAGFDLDTLRFKKINNYPLMKSSFDAELNKQQAYEIISRSDINKKNDEYVEFVLETLKFNTRC